MAALSFQAAAADDTDGILDAYAFDQGEDREVSEKWQSRGVKGIAYTDHKDLWATLGAWADMARDPDVWRQKLFVAAQKGPADLAPFIRDKDGIGRKVIRQIRRHWRRRFADPLDISLEGPGLNPAERRKVA